MLDEQAGTLTSGKSSGFIGEIGHSVAMGAKRNIINPANIYGDTGGASRFFYCAKAGRAERDSGLDHVGLRQPDMARDTDALGGNNPRNRGARARANHHPTVKPLDLMQWLVRLVTPRGGLVLDPFCGSGTTGIAALREGCAFVGIEREPEYAAIARARIAGDAPLFAGGAT